jgi:hypothetical protein
MLIPCPLDTTVNLNLLLVYDLIEINKFDMIFFLIKKNNYEKNEF